MSANLHLTATCVSASSHLTATCVSASSHLTATWVNASSHLTATCASQLFCFEMFLIPKEVEIMKKKLDIPHMVVVGFVQFVRRNK